MSASEAYDRLLASGPFDDPDSSWYPVRWYFRDDGVLCRCSWRCQPVPFPRFVAPGPVRFGSCEASA